MAQSIKALLITLEYPPQVGGVANYYAALVAEQAFSCTVATPDQLPSHWIKMIPWLYRQIKHEHYTHVLVGQVLPLGTVAYVVSLLTRTPYVVFTHGMDVLLPQKSFRKSWLLRRILRKAKAVITASRFTKNQMIKFDASVTHITVINPAASITPVITQLQPEQPLPERYILSVGRLVERKGFDQVIRALPSLPGVDYVIAGRGVDQARLAALVQTCGVADRVHFMTEVTSAQIAYLYAHCLYLVMPSRQLPNGDVEGYGIVVAEANRFGKTAIGGQAGGMGDAIQHEQTGLLVDPTDVAALTAAMRRLLTDAVYRQQLERAALQWGEQQTWSGRAKQLTAVLQ